MDCMTVLLVHSLAPSVCGWEEDEHFCLTPVRRVRCFQKCNMKSLSQSDISSSGSPFLQYQQSKNITAGFSAVSFIEVGIIQISKFNQLMIFRVQSKLSSSGRGPMKYKAAESHWLSGTGNG